MSRGESYGGGQSSLGYLFGSGEKPSASPPTRTVNPPPYGIDTSTDDQKPHDSRTPTEKEKVENNYHRAQGQNSGNFITVSFFSYFVLRTCFCTLSFTTVFLCFITLQDRPSTKVKSVPGGDSSLGYLFGDK